MKWYKRDPDAALVGMLPLNDIEYRAYSVIIDLLYSRNGDLDDNPHLICTYTGWRPQRWRKARAGLLAKGKIHLKPDGKLTANRVETTLKEANDFNKAQAKRARNLSQTSRKPTRFREVSNEKPNENNTPSEPSTTTTRSIRKKEGVNTPSPIRASRARVRTPLPENWSPQLKFDEAEELERFKDYARANAKHYADWDAAWRNWKRSPYRNNGANGHGRRHGSVLDASDRIDQRLTEHGAREGYIPGSSGPQPLRLDQPTSPPSLKLIPKR